MGIYAISRSSVSQTQLIDFFSMVRKFLKPIFPLDKNYYIQLGFIDDICKLYKLIRII
jgi:hypothetical protein